MMGGCVVIFGFIGRNFVVGMFGGVVFVFDFYNIFEEKCNMEFVELEWVEIVEDVVEL